MIEVEKMLYLRRYLTHIVRSQLHLSRYETARSHPPRCKGYVVGHVCPQHASLSSEIYVTICNRIYCTTVSQSSQSDVVDHKLISFCNDVKKGRVSVHDLREVIDLCSKNDYQLPQDIGVLLLKCCGNMLSDLRAVDRDHLTSQVWRLAKKNGALTLEYYNTLLGINEENSKFVNPKEFLMNMSMEPDENTYRLLLNTAIKAGNSEYLWDILSMTKGKNVTIYEGAINALVQIYVNNGNITEVERIITLMQEAKLSTANVYTELAHKYARLGDIPNLVKILNEEPQSNANLLRIIKALSTSNNSRHIPVVLNFLMISVPAIEPEISRIIVELIRADQVTDAHTIIHCFAMNNNVTKDIVQGFVNSFMNELIMLNAPIDDIMKYANDFINSGCSQRVLTDLAETSLKLGREKLCLAIFQAMRNKNIEVRPHYYWPLLLKAYYDEGEAKIFSFLKSMMNEGVEIDSDTLLHYVFPYVNTIDPIATLQKLLLNNVPATVSYTPLLSFLLHQNRLQDMEQLYTFVRYKVYYRELMKPLVRAYLATKDVKSCVMLFTIFPQGQDFVSSFLKLLLKAEYPICTEDLQLLLEKLKECEMKISKEDATILKNRLAQNKNLNVLTLKDLIDDLIDQNIKDSALTLRSKYMNTKELTCFLVELKNSNKAYSKDRILYRLLNMYCVENNLKKAEEIKREYDVYQYEWIPSMIAMLFELYLRHNKLKEAEALLSDFKFSINNIKTVLYATALVKANKPTEAFNVIDTYNIIDHAKLDVHALCCRLLQTLAQSQHYAYTEDMLNLLLKKNYCQVSAELLTPLVMIPLKRNDILDATKVFEKCAKKYYKTPLALEILIVLLKQKYNSKLHNANDYIKHVYDIITNIHTVNVANTHLAIALARLNQIKKLQALLQHHTISVTYLVHQINNTKTDSDIDSLENLFKVVDVNLDSNLDISNALLSLYSKLDDCNRALKLWEIMRTKNIKPNEWFKRNFIQFLSSNKVPLPPELNKINVSNVNEFKY